MSEESGIPPVLFVVGIAVGLWSLAILTNFRGYRESHLRRTIASGYRSTGRLAATRGQSANDRYRRFLTVVQIVVAVVFLVAVLALFISGLVEILG